MMYLRYRRLLSDTARIREKAEQLWRLILPHLAPVPDVLSKTLFEDLSKDLLPLLSKFLEEAGKGMLSHSPQPHIS